MIVDLSAPGWPRKRAEYRSRFGLTMGQPKQLPNLYIGGDAQWDNNWTDFDSVRSLESYTKRLCAVCGEKLESDTLYGAVFDYYPYDPKLKYTNGPGCHPKCFAMALKFCPHFNENWMPEDGTDPKIVAYYWNRASHAFYRKWCEEGSADGQIFGGSFRVFSTCIDMTREDCLALATGKL